MKRTATRSVALLTTGRADYGLLRPVMDALRRRRGIRPRWIATGQHLARRLGATIVEIQRDGDGGRCDQVEMLLDSDTPAAIAKSMGVGMIGFAELFGRKRPDILVVLGDRFEALAAVASALPFNIVVAHLHGGEATEGLIDEAIRHAITKMSHLHFVSTTAYAQRVKQMGEAASRVFVSGAPGVDNIVGLRPTSSHRLERRLGVPIGRDTLLVTYHPETLRPARTAADIDALMTALGRVSAPIVFTCPNADTARDVVQQRIEAFVRDGKQRVLVSNLGRQDYLSLMKYVGAMVGNSSSGIIEAPSFGLPVVNIGARQRGRVAARNVIAAASDAGSIEAAIRRALSPAFQRSLRGLRNPYGDGRAAERIARTLAAVRLDEHLLLKSFVDHP